MTKIPFRALLATSMIAMAAGAAAPSAQAGWITGNAKPPVWSDTAACHNGMRWSYATAYANRPWPVPIGSTTTINAHAVVVAPPGSGIVEPPPLVDTVSLTGTYTIPQRPLTVTATTPAIAAVWFPLGPTGRRVNQFDYSQDFTIPFNRQLPWGTSLRMQWRYWGDQITQSRAVSYYRVAHCWVVTIVDRTQLSVRLDENELRTIRLDEPVPLPCKPGDEAIYHIAEKPTVTGC
jgi:hypothetical protein